MQAKKYENRFSESQILFISQFDVGESLSRFAAEFASYVTNYEIVYKLHPKEMYDWINHWSERYPWLADAPVTVVDDPNVPLHELQAKSQVQVGVYSTALYEGLKFGLDTYLVDDTYVERMQWAVNEGTMKVVQSPEELTTSIRADGQREDVDITRFFEPNGTENFERAIEGVIDDF